MERECCGSSAIRWSNGRNWNIEPFRGAVSWKSQRRCSAGDDRWSRWRDWENRRRDGSAWRPIAGRQCCASAPFGWRRARCNGLWIGPKRTGSWSPRRYGLRTCACNQWRQRKRFRHGDVKPARHKDWRASRSQNRLTINVAGWRQPLRFGWNGRRYGNRPRQWSRQRNGWHWHGRGQERRWVRFRS